MNLPEPNDTPYERVITRRSSRARIEAVCWALRNFARLQLSDATKTPRLRRRLQQVDRLVFHPPWLTRCTSTRVAGVPCEWIAGPGVGDATERVLLYLHGGGFAFHLPKGYRSFAARVSAALGLRVLLPDYRLAPEHPYPAAQDDVLGAYRGLLALGVPASRVVVAGDSAGGNLTLGLLQRLRREGLPQPGCAVALSPVTDVTLSGASMRTRARADPLLDADSLPILRDMALPDGSAADSVVSPLHGEFDAALAPTLVLCGTREILLDDARRYAQRAHAGGAPVALEVWEDMPHVFPILVQLRESRGALRHIARFVAAALDDAGQDGDANDAG